MAEATVSDKFAQVRGFKVEITGAGGRDVDVAWESVSEGVVMLDHPHHAGACTAPEITLRGPLTATRKALMTWLNNSAAGKRTRRDVTITVFPADPAEPAKAVTYLECFLTGYAVSPLDATDPRQQPIEEVRFVPGLVPRPR